MKALVIFSGGIDSAVCLIKAISKYGNDKVTALTFDYGQKNKNEIKKAKELCDYYEVEQIVMKIDNLFKYSNSSMLVTSNIEIPKISYEEQIKKKKANELVSTNVPFRNGILLSIASSIAIAKDIEIIYYGIHNEGIANPLYPDCSKEFNDAISNAIFLGSGKKVKILAPLVNKTKNNIIKMGIDLKVPFEKTWSCYENGTKPCMKCTACRDRLEGFKNNKMVDPIMWV